MKEDYWTKFWKDYIPQGGNMQQQVRRTIKKVPIDDARWDYTVGEISNILKVGPDDNLLDLGAGNGLISKPFSKKCRSVTAVDISSALLMQIDRGEFPNIKIVIGDVRNIQFAERSFSKCIMYFAMQYFTEKEAIDIFESVHSWLVPGGTFFIGDIPDVDQRWTFFNTSERVDAYFKSIRQETPILGTWFKRDFLEKLGWYTGFSACKILDQDPKLINAHYRFDLKLIK
jgi:cyclopropane fatty-acyl-phospholipid synthase-like methyltransferase